MPVNPYINYYGAANEQKLMDDLAIEFVKFYGIDCIYMPRTLNDSDELQHEDDRALFNNAVYLEMYVKNVEGFQGDGDFLSKFGLQIRDSMTFSVSITRCKEELGEMRRPMEGDLIYFPLNKKIFEIMFVEHEAVFYQNGALQFYDLKAELFEYSNESFQTGIPEIDMIGTKFNTSTPEAIQNLRDVDPIADNEIIQEFTDGILDFSELDPYSTDGRY